MGFFYIDLPIETDFTEIVVYSYKKQKTFTYFNLKLTINIII